MFHKDDHHDVVSATGQVSFDGGWWAPCGAQLEAYALLVDQGANVPVRDIEFNRITSFTVAEPGADPDTPAGHSHVELHLVDASLIGLRLPDDFVEELGLRISAAMPTRQRLLEKPAVRAFLLVLLLLLIASLAVAWWVISAA